MANARCRETLRPWNPRAAHVYFAFDQEFTGPRVDRGRRVGETTAAKTDAILAIGYVISVCIPSDDGPSAPMQLVAVEEGCIIDMSLKPQSMTEDGWREHWTKMSWHLPTFEAFWKPRLECLNSLYDDSSRKSAVVGRGKMARHIRRKINQFETIGTPIYRSNNMLFAQHARSEGELYALVESFTLCTDSAGQDQMWLDCLLMEKNYPPSYLCQDYSFPRGARVVHVTEPFWAGAGCAPHEYAASHQSAKRAISADPYAFVSPAPYCEPRIHRHDPTYDCYCLLALFMVAQCALKHNRACADVIESINRLNDTGQAYMCIKSLFTARATKPGQ